MNNFRIIVDLTGRRSQFTEFSSGDGKTTSQPAFELMMMHNLNFFIRPLLPSSLDKSRTEVGLMEAITK